MHCGREKIVQKDIGEKRGGKKDDFKNHGFICGSHWHTTKSQNTTTTPVPNQIWQLTQSLDALAADLTCAGMSKYFYSRKSISRGKKTNPNFVYLNHVHRIQQKPKMLNY